MPRLDSKYGIILLCHEYYLIVVVESSLSQCGRKTAVLFKVEQMINRIIEDIIRVILTVEDLIQDLLDEHAVCYASGVLDDNERKACILSSRDDFRGDLSDTALIEIYYQRAYPLYSESGYRLLLSSDVVLARPEVCYYHLFLNAVAVNAHVKIGLVKHGYRSYTSCAGPSARKDSAPSESIKFKAIIYVDLHIYYSPVC